MGVKRSFKQILLRMASKRIRISGLSLLMAGIMAAQMVVMPVGAAAWFDGSNQESKPAASAETTDPTASVRPTEPKLKNTFALVVATGGQGGDAIEYFKVVYEDTAGIRRSEYILSRDSAASFKMAQAVSSGAERREKANQIFNSYGSGGSIADPADYKPLQPESRNTYLFETIYEVKRIVGIEIMHNAGQWDCQGLWIYEVDEIFGEEMYGYVADDGFISFSGWRVAELEMRSENGELIYTTLQNSRPKLYRMGEEGHPEFNLMIYDRSEAEYDSTANSREYAMRLDITDVYGAGIERGTVGPYRADSIENTKFRDALRMEVRYQDTFGCVQTVSTRVLSGSMVWALDMGVPASTVLAGYAQQGDTLLLPLKLPYFADLLEVKLHYDWTASGGIDELNLSSISLYDLTLSQVDVTVDAVRAAIVPSITYNPIYLWKTGSRQGYVLSPGEVEIPFEMRLNEDSLTMVDEPLTDEYLVEIVTDDMPSAATTSDISVLLNYVTYGGVAQRTEKILLREQSRDFHGYTPGGDDMYYWMGMRPGGRLYFRITIPYVSQFTGVTFALEDGAGDDWQMSEVNIYRLDELSRRQITWGSFSAGGVTTDRYYSRAFQGDLAFSSGRSLLVQKEEEVTIQAGEGGAYSESTLPDSSVSWGDIKYSMSYEESLQDIGFTKTRNTYQVEVTVAGNSALAGSEDAGSKNQFYFQLVFQDGSSAFVQANQQLSGDGFRAGYTETFTIKTNQDYGELLSVRVIPEDISSKSDSFDKLNIDSIQVIRRSDGGLSRQWSVERVGWIDIDFRDEGAASGMLGQSGRSEEEMVRTYNVTYSTYAVNLLVAITTMGMPFSGTVYGDMCYYNSAGEAKHMGFDIVQLMYEYANKTPRYTSGVNADGSTAATFSAWSDPYMFQADKTDRFIITLSDARELVYLDIDAYMEGLEQGQGGTWHIGGVAVSLIESEGHLLLNANNEYERDNAVRLLTTNVDTNRVPAYQLLMEHNAKTSQRIHFIENEIDLDTNRGNVSVLAREPVSQNDVLNIYVYPNLELSDPSTDYSIKAAATYTSPRGMRQASAGTLDMAGDGSVFYMLGVKASGMTVLNQLSIQAESRTNIPNAYIDYAIVQQVRSGVIINTYEIDYGGASAAYGQLDVPVSEKVDHERAYVDEQVVTFSIGKGIDEPLMLQPETKDLAVALRYVPENQPEGMEREYDSPFIYLTDQQISMLRSGQIVSLTFREDYVDEITGVVMVATGGLTVPIDMACVGSYRVASATGERVERGWYSFSEFVDSIDGAEVGRTDRLLGYTGDSVKPLKLQFVTAPATENTESGINGSVELTISYVDDYGAVRTRTIPDLRPYATNETPFATDTVTDVELLVVGVKELRWLEIRPYDDRPETDIGWRLSSVSAQLGHTGEVQKRSVDEAKAILESAGRKINYSTVSVLVNVQAKSNTGSPTNVNVLNESTDIWLDSGQPANLKVTVNGSDEGFTVKAERVASPDSTAAADAGNFLKEDGEKLVFEPERNYTGANIYYRITVSSVEVGSKTVINFVQGFEKEPESTTPSTESSAEKTPAPSEDAGSDTGSDTGSDAGSNTGGEGEAASGSEMPQ